MTFKTFYKNEERATPPYVPYDTARFLHDSRKHLLSGQTIELRSSTQTPMTVVKLISRHHRRTFPDHHLVSSTYNFVNALPGWLSHQRILDIRNVGISQATIRGEVVTKIFFQFDLAGMTKLARSNLLNTTSEGTYDH